jgi:hypothetical protein
MPSHAEMEVQMQRLSSLSMDDPRSYKILDTYFESLSISDQLYAAQYGAALSDARIRQACARWSGDAL